MMLAQRRHPFWHLDSLHKGSSCWEGWNDLVLLYLQVDVTSLSREERIAFFLNTYNALVVHALATFGPASNLLQR